MELAIRSDAGGVYVTRGETSVSGPYEVDRVRGRQPNPIARKYRKAGEVSCLLEWDKCARWIQRVTPDPYLPHHFESYSVWPTLWLRCSHALDSVMRVTV